MNLKKLDLIILASGIGSRAKLDFPKQYLRLDGKPILIHILEKFRQIESINKIIITCISEYIKETEEIINKYDINNCICINGNITRQKSVYNGLQYITTDRVIIHESVRPFINVEFIKKLININNNHSNDYYNNNDNDVIVPVVSAIPTIYYNNEFLNRDNVFQVQLPQVFNTNKLKLAHNNAKKRNIEYTDDSSLIFGELNIKPTLIPGLEENIKITTPLDVKIAEVIYETINNSNRRF